MSWNKTKPYCRELVFNGVAVYGGTYLANSSYILYQTSMNPGYESYFMYTISEDAPFMRVMLDYTGKLKSLSWSSHSSSWALIAERPTSACDLYASCGPYSYCDLTKSAPMCQCLDGFEPSDNNFLRGCRRIAAALKCGNQSYFLPLPDMKVPDNFLHIRNKSFNQCETECRRNCSCTAFAYANMNMAGAMADPTRCLIWLGDLIDTAKRTTTGEYLYLRLADSPGICFSVTSFSLQVIN